MTIFGHTVLFPRRPARPAPAAVSGRGRMSAIALGTVLALITVLGGTAHAQASPKRFVWRNDIRSGDCTMFHGASWTLYSDGTAEFNGLVTSSDDNDAWLMWANLEDANKNRLGRLVSHSHWDDLTKFVKNLPDSSRQYPWSARATYDPSLYPRIKSMSLNSHC
ncbi:DUF6294 family protein [Streptosporangium sp. NPDC051023]|uniref:DUF6294 family protein n=1 Tax=Streptosporangium sp. NPDC051023 TaxID=3155410 RepID=UPI00344C3CEF